jgi:hypothetical protein
MDSSPLSPPSATRRHPVANEERDLFIGDSGTDGPRESPTKPCRPAIPFLREVRERAAAADDSEAFPGRLAARGRRGFRSTMARRGGRHCSTSTMSPSSVRAATPTAGRGLVRSTASQSPIYEPQEATFLDAHAPRLRARVHTASTRVSPPSGTVIAAKRAAASGNTDA